MRLAILGSLPAAEIVAAWAAAMANEKVLYLADNQQPGLWETRVSWETSSYRALIERAQPGGRIAADAFLIIATREEAVDLTRAHAQSMRGKPILLAPGGFSITETIDGILNTGFDDTISAIGQVTGFPVTGDVEQHMVTVRSVKRNLPLGQLHNDDPADLVSIFRRWLPDLTASTLAETTLSNTNNIIHPPILLANAARTEGGDDYLFYREGLSGGAGHMIDRIDEERLAILAALGYDRVPLVDWFRRYDGERQPKASTARDELVNRKSLATSKGPRTLRHRYLTEDITYGLAPMEELARRLRVETPFLSALITVMSTLSNSNLRIAAGHLVDHSSLLESDSTKNVAGLLG